MDGKIVIREKIILGALILLLLAGGGWRLMQAYRTPEPEIIQADNGAEAQPAAEIEAEMITVHLVGEVKNPGVYRLPEGARVYELLEKGGGFTDNADREAINQARPLMDGEQVRIHRVDEITVPVESGVSDLININRASARELTALPGIGEARAAQIVEHREKHGFFRAKEEIMDVSGIGQATFDNFEAMITVY